jgi:hypothetical protein
MLNILPISNPSRVTRGVWKNITQNAAEPIFSSILIHSFFRGKEEPQKLSYFRKKAQRKESPNRRKFAQSGRPDIQGFFFSVDRK